MKPKSIKQKYGTTGNCANCENFRFDESCRLSDANHNPADKCSKFNQRIKLIKRILISTAVIASLCILCF